MKLLFFCVVSQIISIILCDDNSLNVHDKMYIQLEATFPCVLRLNGTQSFGCTSSRNGNVGVIHIVHNDSDLKWVLDSGEANSYVVGLYFPMFSIKNLKKLNSSSKVSGILYMQKVGRDKLDHFSPEDKCPNRYSGLAGPKSNRTVCDDEKPWNTFGSNIMLFKWNIPIFFTDNNVTISEIEQCFQNFNSKLDNSQLDHPLCALEMSAHMYGSVDSTTCIRRSNMAYNLNPIRYCDPLGDKNIYVPLIPFQDINTFKKSSIIIVAARLDSTSLFYGKAPGSLSTVTSLVTLLLTANLLANLTQKNSGGNTGKNVLFILFNGEAYDYIGSSRIVYDMENGQFPFKEKPINKDHISLFIELSQINIDEKIVYHSNQTHPEVEGFISKFESVAHDRNFNVNLTKSTAGSLPPSSMQNFLVMKNDMPGFIFSSYDNQFENKYYHSMYDDDVNINYTYRNKSPVPDDSLQAFIAKFSTVLAYTLYNATYGYNVSENPPYVSSTLTDELLHCYLDTINCDFFKEVGVDISSSSAMKPDYYVGVTIMNYQMSLLTKYALEYLMGKSTNITNEEECNLKAKTSLYSYIWSSKEKRCLESAVNFSEALSPAFIIPEYDLSSGLYSSWTESSWQLINVRMFLKPSLKYERLVFGTGISIMITSFLVVFWIKFNARELFNYPHLISASNI